MKNNGFTLIELIAIVVILALIFLVSFPQILNISKTDEEKKYNDMVENLCLAGQSYIYANMDSYKQLSTAGEKIELEIQDLINYGNVDKSLKNPQTNKNIEDDILRYIVLSDFSLDCKYIDS